MKGRILSASLRSIIDLHARIEGKPNIDRADEKQDKNWCYDGKFDAGEAGRVTMKVNQFSHLLHSTSFAVGTPMVCVPYPLQFIARLVAPVKLIVSAMTSLQPLAELAPPE